MYFFKLRKQFIVLVMLQKAMHLHIPVYSTHSSLASLIQTEIMRASVQTV